MPPLPLLPEFLAATAAGTVGDNLHVEQQQQQVMNKIMQTILLPTTVVYICSAFVSVLHAYCCCM
jgi:hypothetical protein